MTSLTMMTIITAMTIAVINTSAPLSLTSNQQSSRKITQPSGVFPAYSNSQSKTAHSPSLA